MNQLHQFVRVEFHRFKAFKAYTLDLRNFNVLVGPNNAGKSTILAAFRMLAHAMRRAESRKAVPMHGPNGLTHGHDIDLSQISVADENLFYNYDDDEPAWVRFQLSSGNALILYFPEHGVCRLFPDAQGRACLSPTTFKTNFPCPIGFVPILGPVEQSEELNERETARRALFNYRAARNFRNTWYHFPAGFEDLQSLVKKTWPGMDVIPPEVNSTHEKPRLELWCPEDRRPREIAWAGFGFQVWCQMLTHIVRWRQASIFLIDEPDIYLHSDLQRQLVGILRDLGPDIVLATHSTEIVTESETEDIVLIDKRRSRSRRLKRPDQLGEIFQLLGSSINPILTQIAKTRRVLFVEGGDFQLLGRFARRLGYERIANRADFAVVRAEGFNPERVRNLKAGMEETLGVEVSAALILDSDYRPDVACRNVEIECGNYCRLSYVLRRKEIENFLLVPHAIDRAANLKLAARAKRDGTSAEKIEMAEEALLGFADAKKTYVMAQRLEAAKRFERETGGKTHEATINERLLVEFENLWPDSDVKFSWIGGKEAFSFICRHIQDNYGVSLTPASVIDAMTPDEIPQEIRQIIARIADFSLA